MLPTKYQRIKALLFDNRHNLLYVFVLSLLMLIPAAVSPIYKQVFSDYILSRGVTEWLPTLIALMLGTALFSAMLILLQRVCLQRLANKIEISGESRYIWRLLHAPLSLFLTDDSFVLLSKMDAAKGVSSILTKDVLAALFSLINVIFYLVMMLRVDWMMALVVVGLILLSYVMGKLQGRLMSRATSRTGVEPPPEGAGTLSKMDERMSAAGLQGIETIKGGALELPLFQRLMSLKVATVHARRAADYSAASSPLNTLPSILFLNLLLFISALRIMDQNMTIGTYLAFQAYASAFFAPLNQALNLKKQFDGFESSLKGYGEELQQQDAPKQGCAPSPERLSGRIEFRDVRFGYDPEKPVLEHFNLTIEPGKRVAIVGKSGSGKSTIIRLLQGLHRPQDGQVLLDGQDIATLDRAVLMNSLGSANQQISVFSASIRDNITLWDTGIPDSEVYRAASDACLHKHIASLNGAYDYALAENGRNLSGGQRQRLEIARALLYDPAIVLLDEAMGALDIKTASRIDRNIRKRGCTLVFTSKSLGVIRHYDEILVLDEGRIQARGTHEQLLTESEYYASLFESEGWMLA